MCSQTKDATDSLSGLWLLSLSAPQLVCDWETPAQSPEHEQYDPLLINDKVKDTETCTSIFINLLVGYEVENELFVRV
ncbi:hypothetical protein NQZ68_026804 [Dissostichus eleginoides]|nr:hypothetical protein NQZ68_026804 [Dissostichus eleginoides]